MNNFGVGMCCGLALMGCVWMAFEAMCRPVPLPAVPPEPKPEYHDPTLAADWWKTGGDPWN
jgi:hypothetical protein